MWFLMIIPVIKYYICIFQDWDINNVSNGRTMLHKACDYGHLDIVEYLIQNGADINVSSYLFISCFLFFSINLLIGISFKIKI